MNTRQIRSDTFDTEHRTSETSDMLDTSNILDTLDILDIFDKLDLLDRLEILTEYQTYYVDLTHLTLNTGH